MNGIRTAIVLALAAAMVVPVGALAIPAAPHGDAAPAETAQGTANTGDASLGASVAAGTEVDAPATVAVGVATGDAPANNTSASVGVGQQLSTVIEASESDVSAEVEESAFEASYERAEGSERAEAVAERAEELRERGVDVREDYREATREFENGDLSRSGYAQRIAVLNARARNVVAAHERLERRAANVSGFELASAGLNRTALRQSIDDLDSLTGAGPTALLERFTGQREGEVEIERADGLSIEVESEDGERSREVEIEGARDDDDAITVEQSAALETARSDLSDQQPSWVLERASVHPDSGYYKFEFVLWTANSSGEAEVRVDGSTGEVFRLEEEFEPREDDEHEDDGEHEADGEGEVALVVTEGTPAPNATVTVQVLADGEPVPNQTVSLDGESVAETGPDGTADVTLPAGDSELSVEVGDEDADLAFEFEEGGHDDLSRNLETNATYDGGSVSLSVAYDGTGVENVTVYADDRRVGATDSTGGLAFTTTATEELEIELVASDLTVELEYRIRDDSLVLEKRALAVDADEGDDDRDDEIDDLTISVVEGEPARNTTVTVRVLADGEPAENATVAVDGEPAGQTDADGRLAVTLPDADEVEVTATVAGEEAEREFEFESGDDATETPEPDDEADVDDLSLSVVAGDPAPGATITVEVTADGNPVEGAAVTVEGDEVGETGADGTIQVTLPDDEDDPRVRAETDDASGRIEFDFEDEDD